MPEYREARRKSRQQHKGQGMSSKEGKECQEKEKKTKGEADTGHQKKQGKVEMFDRQ